MVFGIGIKSLVSILGLALVAGAAICMNKFTVFPGWRALCPTVGAALIIQAGPQSYINRFILSRTWLVWIGLISYPLYLWHWPLLAFAHMNMVEMPLQGERLIAVLLSFILAWVSSRFVETPIRYSKNLSVTAWMLLAVSLIVGGGGAIIYVLQGVPGRFPDGESGFPTQIMAMMDPAFGGDVHAEWRHHKCFLGKSDSADMFANSCLESRKPLVFLWGDSHAAALYPGFRELQRSLDFGLVQRTASVCPPTVNWDNPQNGFCREINEKTLDLLEKVQPNILLIEAQWVSGGYDLAPFFSLLEQVKGKFSGRIVVLGSPPLWKQSVPKNVIEYYRRFRHFPPKYSDYGALKARETMQMDARLKFEVRRRGAEFISMYEKMCNESGCRMRVGESASDVTSFDQGHLSPAGAKVFVKEIALDLFKGLAPRT